MGALRQRSRLTNLAVWLILALLGVSLISNLSHILHASDKQRPFKISEWDEVASLELLDSGRPPSVETTIHRDERMMHVNHLVVVPGHAVWTGTEATKASLDDDWVLERMQRGGSVKTYMQHIKRATDLLQSDPYSLVVFSG